MQMLDISVHPPTQAQAGTVLFPPVAACLRGPGNMYSELSQFWAIATLIDHDGQILSNELGGRVADSAHPMQDSGHGGNRAQAYFYFPDLAIYRPGRYRIRVTLMHMEYSYEAPNGAAVMKDYADSHTVTVVQEVVAPSRPSTREREFLRMLRRDGQDVQSTA